MPEQSISAVIEHRPKPRDSTVRWQTYADYLEIEVNRLREAAEDAVTALLEVLPLEGDWAQGYRVSETIHETVRALPSEWAEAAHAISVLQRLITEGTSR